MGKGPSGAIKLSKHCVNALHSSQWTSPNADRVAWLTPPVCAVRVSRVPSGAEVSHRGKDFGTTFLLAFSLLKLCLSLYYQQPLPVVRAKVALPGDGATRTALETVLPTDTVAGSFKVAVEGCNGRLSG